MIIRLSNIDKNLENAHILFVKYLSICHQSNISSNILAQIYVMQEVKKYLSRELCLKNVTNRKNNSSTLQ